MNSGSCSQMTLLSRSAIPPIVDSFCSSRILPQERLRDEPKGRLPWKPTVVNASIRGLDTFLNNI